jgi:hypothetical protein
MLRNLNNTYRRLILWDEYMPTRLAAANLEEFLEFEDLWFTAQIALKGESIPNQEQTKDTGSATLTLVPSWNNGGKE